VQKKTITKLNQLNQDFYKTIAESFDETRQQSWQGWEQLLPYLVSHFDSTNEITAIDLGCGNGRFASFLAENFQKEIYYIAVDANPSLLEKADQRLKATNIPHTIKNFDIISNQINLDQDTEPSTQPKLITLFGVWHHLPSQQFRQQFLDNLQQQMTAQDLLVIATWNFAREERFAKKTVPPTEIGLEAKELETGDYILDWQRGKSAYRYCHYSPREEMEAHFKKSNLHLLNHFEADGKSEQLNSYYLLTKKA
jgi:2-polyprenyl-3-methyl-5-hydroxy-6-metoxy-1,4-benzoquinol methylase